MTLKMKLKQFNDVIYDFDEDTIPYEKGWVRICRGTSLSGIGKDFLVELKELVIHCDTIDSSILGILRIKNLERCWSSHDVNMSSNLNLLRALKIVASHIPDRDILACQEELIEAGLKEYARL